MTVRRATTPCIRTSWKGRRSTSAITACSASSVKKSSMYVKPGGGMQPERAMGVPRVIVITGGSSGIGHAAALEFARRGDCVTIAARGAEALARTAADIEAAGGQALPITADVSRFDDV